jgi:Zn finger protein HypA/HybF involved in hydrogenase expression
VAVQPKTFDAAARRITTEAERAAQQGERSQKAAAAAAAATAGRWKQQREQLRAALRAARGGDKGSAAEPTVEIVDYRTQCPHCQRKFNADVADRHIPKCAEARARPSAAGSVRSVKPAPTVSAPPAPARAKSVVATEATAARSTKPSPSAKPAASAAKPAAAAAKAGIGGACDSLRARVVFFPGFGGLVVPASASAIHCSRVARNVLWRRHTVH